MAKVEVTEACWLWRASIGPKGYGQFHFDRMLHIIPAHRAAWALMRGPIPEGLTIDHLCRVKHCVNPAHMEVVTSSENTKRSDNPAMQNARATHCKNGHEWAPKNTLRQGPQGQWRWCRECGRERSREYMRRKRSLIKLIKNTHTAAIHLPSAKNMPEVTLAPGVTPVGETRWPAAMENTQICRWLTAGVLAVVEAEAILSEPPPETRTAAGELAAVPLPPLPTKGGKK